MSKIENHVLKTSKTLDESFNEIGSALHKIIEQFSEQVTCTCAITCRPIFNMEKALAFRKRLGNMFYALLECLDEEIDEEKTEEYNKESPYKINWDEHYKTLEKLSKEELLKSHMYESSKRLHLETILMSNGFQYGPNGWDKEIFKKPSFKNTDD